MFGLLMVIYLRENIFNLSHATIDTFLIIETYKKRFNNLISNTIRGGFNYSKHSFNCLLTGGCWLYINRCHCACPLGNLYNENKSDIHSLHESFSLSTLYLIERKVRRLRTACLSPPFICHFCLSCWHHQSITPVLRKSQQKGCWLNQWLTPFKVLMGWENIGSWMHNVCISFPERSVNFIRFGLHGSTGINIAGCCRDMNVSDGSWFFICFNIMFTSSVSAVLS